MLTLKEQQTLWHGPQYGTKACMIDQNSSFQTVSTKPDESGYSTASNVAPPSALAW